MSVTLEKRKKDASLYPYKFRPGTSAGYVITDSELRTLWYSSTVVPLPMTGELKAVRGLGMELELFRSWDKVQVVAIR